MNLLLQKLPFRKLVLCVLLCGSVLSSPAQSPYTRKDIIIPSSEVINISIIRTLDGGIMHLLESADSLQPFRHLTLLKLNNAGTVSWYKYLGSTYSYYPSNIVQSPDSGYFVCCLNGTASYTMFKTDKSGTVLFVTRADLPMGYTLHSAPRVKAKNDGGFYIAASINEATTSTESWHLLEAGANGSIVSSRCYNMIGGKSRVHDVDTCLNGDVLLLGSVLMPSAIHAAAITRIDSGGAVVWSKAFPSTLNLIPVDFFRGAGDLMYVLSQAAVSAGTQASLMKVDGNGNTIWLLNYSAGSVQLRPRVMQRNSEGDILITGEAMFIKVDSAGVPLCARQYPGITFSSLLELSPQMYQLAGIPFQGVAGIILTTDSCGYTCGDTALTIVKTAYTVSDSTLGGSMQLPMTYQPHPMPEDLTTIQFTEPCTLTTVVPVERSNYVQLLPNPASGWVTVRSSERIKAVTLLDVSGRILLSRQAGEREMQLDISGLPSGYYIVLLSFENGSESKRLIVE